MAFDKTKPAGTTPLKTSDDQIRANNEALETAIGQDHDFATGSTQTGKHKQVIFKAPITKPTLTTDEGALYAKTVSTKSELHYEDEDANEVQLTSGGIGGAHPFLLGSTIPSYVGPTNPSSYSWVEQVNNFDASYFTSKTGQGDATYDETWIEGSEEETSSTPTIQGCTIGAGVSFP